VDLEKFMEGFDENFGEMETNELDDEGKAVMFIIHKMMPADERFALFINLMVEFYSINIMCDNIDFLHSVMVAMANFVDKKREEIHSLHKKTQEESDNEK
jgi:hypothetical protein